MSWRRGVGVLAVGIVALAGCGAGSHNPGLSGSSPGAGAPGTGTAAGALPVVTTTVTGSQGSLSWSVPAPQIVGASAAVNAALRQGVQARVDAWVAAQPAGSTASLRCQATKLRADARLLSYRWTCGGGALLTATFSVSNGRLLGLSDLFEGRYLAALSAAAITQLEAGGTPAALARKVAGPTLSAFSFWALDPGALVVAFPLPSGPVSISFPLTSLSAYVVPGGPLG
ncbi:MAG: hypothetical protein ACYC1D_09870 [Acidimicrobiales bacterium]